MRSGLDAVGRNIVERVERRDARRARGEDCLDLTYVEIVETEVSEEDDQAAFAAFFSVFFSSAGASVPPSGRSISVTSASGALSPLRKPLFRMRR